jgi:uncharacterized protein YjiS (DUF1127 family)
MNATRTHHASLAPAVGFTHSLFAAFIDWHKKRRDRVVLDGLSDEQLKDIGYRRLPSGDLEPREW